jgi:hypothetical protein
LSNMVTAMKSSLIGKIGFLLVLFLPIAAVIYFDFPKMRPASPPPTEVASADLPSKPSVPAQTVDEKPTVPQLSEVEKFLAEFGAQLKKLPKGQIVLFAPKAMKVGDKREVEARVGFKVPLEALQKSSSNEATSSGGVLRVSVEMAATLTGPGFTIEPVTPEEQPVAEGFPTVWKWNVSANDSGSQQLEVTVFAIVPDAGGEVRRRIDSYVQTIAVSVRERTWSDTFETFNKAVESIGASLDGIKGIILALLGAGATVMGWLRLSRSRATRGNARQ